MNVILIAACSRNGVIGAHGGLPWHLPEDLKTFKRITLHKTIIMGRKTWISLPVRPLPQRRNIVLSRTSFTALGAEVAHSLKELAEIAGDEECIIIGGAQLFRHFLPLARMIYLTLVATELAGDASFPAVNTNEWEQCSCRHHARDANNKFDMHFLVLQRKPNRIAAASTANAEALFPTSIQTISSESTAPMFPNTAGIDRNQPGATNESQ